MIYQILYDQYKSNKKQLLFINFICDSNMTSFKRFESKPVVKITRCCTLRRAKNTPTHREGAILQSPCPSARLSVSSHFRNRYLGFYWKKWFYIWYMALAWWLVPCLPFPGLPHIYIPVYRATYKWMSGGILSTT